jgi:predicted RNA-binding protein with PIN domain
MSLQYIIDGYNVINNPFFSQRHKKSKDAKEELVRFIRLARLAGSRKNEVFVIFDGYCDTAVLRSDYSETKLVFTQEETADNYIKRFVEKSGGRKNIVVVSDDRELIFYIRSLGAKPKTVEDFLAPLFIKDNLIMHKAKNRRKAAAESIKTDLNYSQREEIDKELRGLWLEKSQG